MLPDRKWEFNEKPNSLLERKFFKAPTLYGSSRESKKKCLKKLENLISNIILFSNCGKVCCKQQFFVYFLDDYENGRGSFLRYYILKKKMKGKTSTRLWPRGGGRNLGRTKTTYVNDFAFFHPAHFTYPSPTKIETSNFSSRENSRVGRKNPRHFYCVISNPFQF